MEDAKRQSPTTPKGVLVKAFFGPIEHISGFLLITEVILNSPSTAQYHGTSCVNQLTPSLRNIASSSAVTKIKRPLHRLLMRSRGNL